MFPKTIIQLTIKIIEPKPVYSGPIMKQKLTAKLLGAKKSPAKSGTKILNVYNIAN